MCKTLSFEGGSKYLVSHLSHLISLFLVLPTRWFPRHMHTSVGRATGEAHWEAGFSHRVLCGWLSAGPSRVWQVMGFCYSVRSCMECGDSVYQAHEYMCRVFCVIHISALGQSANCPKCKLIGLLVYAVQVIKCQHWVLMCHLSACSPRALFQADPSAQWPLLPRGVQPSQRANEGWCEFVCPCFTQHLQKCITSFGLGLATGHIYNNRM